MQVAVLGVVVRAPQPEIDPRLIDGSWRVVLPKEAIAALKVKRGDHVGFVVSEGRVEIRKVKLAFE